MIFGIDLFLIFSVCKYMFSGLPNAIAKWESKALSNKKINPPFTVSHSFSPKLVWINNSRIRLKCKEAA